MLRHLFTFLSVVSLLLSAIVGCSDDSSNAEAIGHRQLKADALAMLERWEATAPTDRSIPASFWPESIRRLKPRDVYPHMLGVLVVTSKSNRYHTGIYIVTADEPEEETNPSSGSGLNYVPIGPGLHRAEVKIRQPVSEDG